jgi:CDK inhibitor PHO81
MRSGYAPSPTAFDFDFEGDQRLCSLGAAVEFSRANNLLGVFIDADLLVRLAFFFSGFALNSLSYQISVPSLIHGIRDAGLLVGVYGPPDKSTTLAASSGIDRDPVDAVLRDNMVVYTDRSSTS